MEYFRKSRFFRNMLKKTREEIRGMFPFFEKNKGYVYFDNASTTQKPESVLQAMDNYYRNSCANVGRGIYSLANDSSIMVHKAREKVANFINGDSEEIIFTQNASHGINLAARSFFQKEIKRDDIILISELEHSSNFLPWTKLAREKKAKLEIVLTKSDGSLDFSHFEFLLSERVRLVAITAMSNVTGEILDTNFITKKANKYGAYVLVDATQALAHKRIDVKEIGCDFLVGSAHKMYGPFGIGFLYVKGELMKKMEQVDTGGGTVTYYDKDSEDVIDSFERFEVGTKNMASIVGFSAAIDFIEEIGFNNLAALENEVYMYLYSEIKKIQNIYLPFSDVFTKNIVSLSSENISSFDLSIFLDLRGIGVRSGRMCSVPFVEKICSKGLVRISIGVYNTKDEVNFFLETLVSILKKY